MYRLAEQLHQEEQMREKDKHKADTLLRQAQAEEAERHRKANEALQRAACVRQRRLLKVGALHKDAFQVDMHLYPYLHRCQAGDLHEPLTPVLGFQGNGTQAGPVLPWQAEEEERAALELAQRLERKLARKQDMSAKHRELDEGLQRMRARIRQQETLLQV